jgi:hypothetical protein
MSILLTVLLSVVGGIVALVVLLILWLRAKVRKTRALYTTLGPFLMLHTARLKLRIEPLPAGDDDDVTAGHFAQMGKMWAALAAQGFAQLAQLADDDGRRLIVGQHPEHRLVALVVFVPELPPFLEFITLSEANVARVITGEPGAHRLQLASLTVDTEAAPTLEMALAALAAALPGRGLDARMAILLIERLHVARMDSQLARAPGLADMRAHAAVHGGGAELDAEHEQRALDINRSSWLDAVRIALLDNARRKLKLDEEAWGRLDDNLVVVHQGMDADEVIATLSGYELVERLGEQLKRQNFGPAQIFDEINRRLDSGQQRKLVLSLGIPVQARLFAHANALETAGVEPMMVPA